MDEQERRGLEKQLRTDQRRLRAIDERVPRKDKETAWYRREQTDMLKRRVDDVAKKLDL